MYIRCAACHAAQWVRSAGTDEVAPSVTCSKCGRSYDLDVDLVGGVKARELHDHAVEFAKMQEIDLAGAFSVLLGIMSLEEVSELGQSGSVFCGAAESDEPEQGRPDTCRFDRAFLPAVKAGWLTPAQAKARGDREALTNRLASRYKLDHQTAQAVADNQTSLLVAIRARVKQGTNTRTRSSTKRSAKPRPEPFFKIVGRPTRGSSKAVWVATALAGLGLLVGANTWRQPASGPAGEHGSLAEIRALPGTASQPPGDTPRSALRRATEVLNNDTGRAVQVVGPDPHSVLIAYSDSLPPDHHLRPLGLSPGIPASSEVRLGILRGNDPLRPPQAITIRRDPRSRRWFSGDGERPIVPYTAPHAAMTLLETR